MGGDTTQPISHRESIVDSLPHQVRVWRSRVFGVLPQASVWNEAMGVLPFASYVVLNLLVRRQIRMKEIKGMDANGVMRRLRVCLYLIYVHQVAFNTHHQKHVPRHLKTGNQIQHDANGVGQQAPAYHHHCLLVIRVPNHAPFQRFISHADPSS